MKRFLAIALVVAMTLACAAAFAQEKTELIVGIYPEFQPFEFVDDDGNIAGFDADLAAELAKDLGMTLTLQVTAFKDIIPGVASGALDLGISGIYINEDRLEVVDFSASYLEDSLSCIVKEGGGVTDEESLEGKLIGSQTGSVGIETAEMYTDMENCIGFANAATAIQELAGGTLDAVITDTPVAMRILKELDDSTLSILDSIAFDREYYAVAIPKGNDELKAKIDASIARMVEDGTIDKLVIKWDIYGENAE